MKKTIFRIRIILAISALSIIVFYVISAIAQGKIQFNSFSALITTLIIIGAAGDGVAYLIKLPSSMRKYHQNNQNKKQQNIELFIVQHPQFVKQELEHLEPEKNTQTPHVDIKIEKCAFTMSFDGENKYTDQQSIFSDPERLIRIDQANIQYRIKAKTPKLILDDNHSHYSLVAPIGSGKTLYLKKLAFLAATSIPRKAPTKEDGVTLPEDMALLPVYIDLVKFAHSEYIKIIGESEIAKEPDGEKVKQALYEFIANKWKDYYQFVKQTKDYQFVKAIDSQFVNIILDMTKEKHGVLFLLDGLDELPAKKRENMEEIIQALYRAFSLNPAYFVIANREHRYSIAGSDYLRLEDFSLNDIYGFTSGWNGFSDSTAKDFFKSQIENHPRLQALAAIPLALMYMIDMQIHAQDSLQNYLYLHRPELYQHVTNVLLESWDKSFIDTENTEIPSASLLNEATRMQLLEFLAWEMHNHKTYRYPQEQLNAAIKEGLLTVGLKNDDATVSSIYEELILTNGLIRTVIGAPDNYRFLCIPLQEYLASQYLVHQSEEIIHNYVANDVLNKINIKKDIMEGYIEDKFNDPWWEEVLRLFLSQTAKNPNAFMDVQTLISWLKPSDDDPFLTKPIFAGQVLALIKHSDPDGISENALQEITAKLCLLLENPPFPRVQEKLGHILADLGKAELSRVELNEFSNKYPCIQHISDGKKLSPLLLPYLEQATPEIIDRLTDLPNLESNQIVGVLGLINSNPRVGVGLFRALEMLGKRELAQKLCDLLTDATIDTSIRVSIARVLGILGSWNQAGQLIELLSNGAVPEQIRWQVVNTLGMLGTRLGYWGRIKDEQTDLYLVDMLKNKLRNGTDKYVLWNIIITLCATFFAIPNGQNGKENTFALDLRMFPFQSIEHDGVNILNNLLRSDKNDHLGESLNKLLDRAIGDRNQYPEEVWLFICEFIWQLADCMKLEEMKLEDIKKAIAKLTSSLEQKCTHQNECNLRGFCKLPAKCKSDELQEHVLYAEYVVARREKTSVIQIGNGTI